LGVFRLCGFPEIHTRARYFNALMLSEDPLYVLGTSHVNDPEAERMALSAMRTWASTTVPNGMKA
jgi:hypothetical protein